MKHQENHTPDERQIQMDLSKTHDIKLRVHRNMVENKIPLHEQAARYIHENPELYEQFKKFTFQAIHAGRDRIGAMLIIQRIRWDTMLSGNNSYKINNNFGPYMARKFMEEYPAHAGIFTTRKNKKEKGEE